MSKLVEEWRLVVGYEGFYEVSDWGRVRSLDIIQEITSRWGHTIKRIKKGKILSNGYDKDGYFTLVLYKNGVRKYCKVHRLVAEAFISNPNNLPQVNHKDENKQNNCVWNLEWCTQQYNTNYGTARERMVKKQSKQVYQYTLDGELVKIWSSASECGRNGYDQWNISGCCNGRIKTHKGYVWKYAST